MAQVLHFRGREGAFRDFEKKMIVLKELEGGLKMS